MDMTERLNILTGHCREAGYPETLINAIASYLSGQGTLAQVQQDGRHTLSKARHFRQA